MPTAFFAMSWAPEDPRAADHAARIRMRMMDGPVPPVCIEAQGFLLADLSQPAAPRTPMIELHRTDGRLGGVIFGTLFPRQGQKRLTDIRHAAATSLLDTNGRGLYRDYWGSYVAFFRAGDDLAVHADPVSSIPCFYSAQDGVTLIFSNLELCPFLDRKRLSLNLRFISTLMAYDKIQNGETGLNEVKELLGGQRMMARSPDASPETLWDPREIARDMLEPDPETAARLLRETAQEVVGAWADCVPAPAVDLSGGLDSSIVLACLVESAAPAPHLAVHHIVDSGDPPEVEFARAAAAYLGADLAEIRFRPTGRLPDAGAHPASARPYRQFLSQNFNAQVAEACGGMERTYLTGQGGDHLLHAARTPFGFTDYLRQHGPGRQSLFELASSARLSGQSVWRVLRENTPEILGRQHKSPLLAAIAARSNRLNKRAQDGFDPDGFDPAYALPGWARVPDGLPPGKFDQVSGLLHMMQVQERLFQPSTRELVHPLMSQPLIELCLRLPVWRLSLGGVSRGLARRAFDGCLPDRVRLRMTKGEATRYFIDQLRLNRSLLLETLADGELVANGIADRKDVETFLREDQFLIHPAGRMILVYYAIEAWLRTWKSLRAAP
jgi:asparagine synthase (glutamine-hydrolysing)